MEKTHPSKKIILKYKNSVFWAGLLPNFFNELLYHAPCGVVPEYAWSKERCSTCFA